MTNQQQPPEFLSADCERVQDALFSQMETDVPVALNPDAQAFLDAHLIHCQSCRLYRHSMQHLQLSLQELDMVEPPAGLEDRIMGKIAALPPTETMEPRESVSQAAPRKLNWKKFAPLAAAVLVLAVAIPLVTQTLAPQPHPATGQQVAQAPAVRSKAVSIPQGKPTPIVPQEIATALPSANLEQPVSTAPSPVVHPHKALARQATNTAGINGQQLAYNPSDNSDFQTEDNAAPEASTTAGNTTDATQLASASASQSISQPFGDTYASEKENDVYYDPVSTLVGF